MPEKSICPFKKLKTSLGPKIGKTLLFKERLISFGIFVDISLSIVENLG